MDTLHFKTTMTFTYGVPDPMAPAIVRLVAPNPSLMTFRGTNSYLVGTTSLAVVDPGPESAAHLDAILAAAGQRPITHIFITHTHRDHSDGARALAEKTGAIICAALRDRDTARMTAESQPAGRAFVDYDFVPDRVLQHDDTIDGPDWSLRALHTPGHAPDHMCYASEAGRALFSGDHVMAWNTTVIAPPEGRMADYIKSLELLLERDDRIYLPGHGGRIEQPARTLKAYLVHRQWRELAVLEAIKAGADTVPAVAARVYSTIDPRMAKAAELTVTAHVEYLTERRLVACERTPALRFWAV